MTATVAGPYEHTGPYVEAELFDTAGTPSGFCPECEHAPCVAGAKRFCLEEPRFISTQALVNEIEALSWKLYEQSPPLQRALMTALNRIAGVAWFRGFDGDRAIWTLVQIRKHLRAGAGS